MTKEKAGKQEEHNLSEFMERIQGGNGNCVNANKIIRKYPLNLVT